MNRFTLLACVSLTAISLSGQMAAAEDFKPYVSVFAGASLPSRLTFQDSVTGGKYDLGLDAGYLIGAAIGMQVTDQLRAEIELSRAFYKSNGSGFSTYDGGYDLYDSGNVRATYLLANAWLDIPTGGTVTPYVGGGAGLGWVGGDVLFDGGPSGFGAEKAAGFAFQVGGGVKIDVSSNVAIDVGYRFKDIIGAKTYETFSKANDWDHVNLASHNIQIGLTYKF
jgi:opacity protein-like surface antigen